MLTLMQTFHVPLFWTEESGLAYIIRSSFPFIRENFSNWMASDAAKNTKKQDMQCESITFMQHTLCLVVNRIFRKLLYLFSPISRGGLHSNAIGSNKEKAI